MKIIDSISRLSEQKKAKAEKQDNISIGITKILLEKFKHKGLSEAKSIKKEISEEISLKK